MLIVKCAALHFRKAAQRLVAAAAFFHGHYAGHFRGGCIGAFGVSEHVQVRNIQVLQEPVGFQKIGFRFTGKTHNHVAADAGVRHQAFGQGYAFGIHIAAVAAAHLAQLFVVAGL